MTTRARLTRPSRRQRRAVLWAAIGWIAAGGMVRADAASAQSPPKTVPPSATGAPVTFNREIRPILSENCFHCHGFDPSRRKADLRLDLFEGATATNKDGAMAIKPGDLKASELWRRVSATDPKLQMPPPDSGKKLQPEQVARLGQWIEQGAKYQKHWAFEAPVRPEVPPVRNTDWPRGDVDRFILAAQEAKQLAPAPEARKEALLRRVTLDLTGLPPTPAEVDAFLADHSPSAYETLVDRLLASPRYGEHMARYWLDVARYGDTHGLHLDNERSMWPYRDWVVSAFNRNLPFDQFTIWQLAGDLLPEATREQRIASGFNRCNVSTSEGGAIDEEFRVRYAVDRVETTSAAWLGLTMGCAVCHDHKLDPITQKEFYQVFTIFNNISEKAMDGNALLPPPTLQAPTPEQEQQLADFDAQWAELEQKTRAAVAKISYTDPATRTNAPQPEPKENPSLSLLAWEKSERGLGDKSQAPAGIKAALKQAPEQRDAAERQQLRDYFLARAYADAGPELKAMRESSRLVREKREALEKAIPATMVSQELEKPRPAWVLTRGQYDQHGEPVSPGVPAVLPALPPSDATNRLTFAQWLVDPKHPLTARVTVNRFWQQFLGTGLVKTSEDFGTRGEWPSHPELLDWLAAEFIRTGWDVKGFVKRLVTSATYRQDSGVTPRLFEMDQENRLLARGPKHRLDAEVLRDNALFVSGLLVEKRGGRGVRPYQPSGIWEAVGYTTSNTAKYSQDKGEALWRRSLYTFWKRTAPPPEMTTFDAPSREQCRSRRERTDTPLQALTTMNAVTYFEAARHLGYRMLHEGGPSDADRLRYGFRLVTARTPAEAECAVLSKNLQAQRTRYAAEADAAKKAISLGDSPAPADVPPAELAAYTMVANLLLNLDEVLTKN